MRHGDEPDLVVEEGIERVERKAGRLGVDRPFAHFDAAIGKAPPVAGIGLMVLVGDHDGVAGLEPGGKGIAQHIGIGG